MDVAEIKRAEALLHHEWAAAVLKVHEGEVADPPVTFIWVGWALKDWLRDNDVAGMERKELGLAIDGVLRNIGYCIAPLADEPTE